MYDCSLLILYVVICILWSKRHTSLLITKAIGVPPVWPVWVLLLWQADCGWSGWLGWSLVQLVPDPVSCRGCWLAGLGHRAAGCGTLGEGRAHVGSFAGGVGAQLGVDSRHWSVKPGPGFVLSHWWTDLGSGIWLQGPGVPELVLDCCGVGPFPNTAGCAVQGVLKLCWPASGWCHGPASPGLVLAWRQVGCSYPVSILYQLPGEAGLAARAGLLVGGSGTLGQVSVPWWVELGPRISDCRGLGFLDLVLAHWCKGPGLGPLVGRAGRGLRGSLRQLHLLVGEVVSLLLVAQPELSRYWRPSVRAGGGGGAGPWC